MVARLSQWPRGGFNCKSGAEEAVQNWVRNLLLRAKFRVHKIIIFFTSWPNIGWANAHPCALASAAPDIH